MKHRMWQDGVNPLVIANGIPTRALDPVDPVSLATFRDIVSERFPLLKIGRFDPDKRWMMAAEAVARLKGLGVPVLWLVRGGMEPHGREVMGYLGWAGLGGDRHLLPAAAYMQECLELIRSITPMCLIDVLLAEESCGCSTRAAPLRWPTAGTSPSA